MAGWSRAASAAVVLVMALAPLRAQELRIGGEKVRWEELPASMPDSAHAALDAWRGFAEANDYALRLDAELRVLLLSPKGDKRTGRRAKLIEQAADRFDRILPLVGDGALEEAAGAEPEAQRVEEIPEDPEGEWEDPFAEDEVAESEPEPEAADDGPAAWGAGTPHVPDGETAVMIALRDRDDLGLLLRDLVGRFPHLTDWAPVAAGQAGFVLQLPLLGASLIQAPEQEEWQPLNELVNRVSQLLVLRRFGPQPHWIVQGLAWDAELELLDAVYCFPHRDGFVEVGEHTGWKLDLKQRIGRLERDLSGEDFMHWERRTYVDRYARYSWGLMHYLSKERPTELAAFLARLREFAHEHNRRELDDGRWERIPDFAIPLSTQEELLDAQFGAGLWGAASRYFTG